MASRPDLRHDVDVLLTRDGSRPVDGKEWSLVFADAEDADRHGESLEPLVERIRRAREARQQGGEERRQPIELRHVEESVRLRAEVRTAMTAAELEKAGRVRRFRGEVLGGELVEPERIEEWFASVRHPDVPVRVTLETVYPEADGGEPEERHFGVDDSRALRSLGWQIEVDLDGVGGWPKGATLSRHVVTEYPAIDYWNGDRKPRHEPAGSATLRRLAEVVRFIRRWSGWSERDSSTWLLTGVVPSTGPGISVNVSVRLGPDIEMGEIPYRPKVTIVVDADTDARVVESAFREAQTWALSGDRVRGLEVHTLRRLLVWLDLPDDMTRQDKWNAMLRDDPELAERFSGFESFDRTMRRARDRVCDAGEPPSRFT